ncbi:hypothetical protein D3C72_1483740 [compost metagenome]
MLSGTQDVTDLRLLPGERVHVQQLRKAQDRVERGTQFVAHARQEFAFGPAGALGFFAGGAQRNLGRAAIGNVPGDLRKPAQRAAAVVLRGDHHAGPEAAAILANAPCLFHVVPVASGLTQGHLGMLRALLRQVKHREVLADDFLFRVALDPLGAGVPTSDITLGVEGEDPVVLHAVDDQPQALFIVAQRSLAFSQQ